MHVLKSLVGACMLAGCASAGPSLWPTATPADVGLTGDLAAKTDAAQAAGALGPIHGVVVIRHGKLVLERYYKAQDEHWGRDLGVVAHGPETQHDLRSISKSIVGLLYGIALAEGIVPGLDEPVVAHFPAYADLADDPDRQKILIRHVLTMTMGLAWDETIPYSDPRNSEIAMERADDRYRFILEQPIQHPPGERWNYSGGSTALLAHLIARGSGGRLENYARDKLFRPLGIRDWHWTNGFNGEAAAASGLRMRARDLAKVGQMVLQGGHWDGKQVVPKDWLEQSFVFHTATNDGLHYGFQWWLGVGKDKNKPWKAGFGNGGQRLIVMPSIDTVMVYFAGAYNQRDSWKGSVGFMRQVLLPSLPE